MFNRGVFILVSVACFVASSAVQSLERTRVVDLTNATANPAVWKIVASGAGGPIGTWPIPPSHVPATIHLSDCVVGNAEFYFSVEIENNRKLELEVPISMNSKLFDRKGTIRFRELLIRLGTASNTQDATTFKNDPRFNEIILFGDQSVPGTIALLAPEERLVLRLKSEMQSQDKNLSSLRVSIGAFDETLSPSGGGFRKIGTSVPALFTMSEPTCSESKAGGTPLTR